MKKYYFVGKRPDEITRAPFLYTNEDDAREDLKEYPKDDHYAIFEVTVCEVKIGVRNVPKHAENI